MVHRPETLVICSARFLNRRKDHSHESYQHDITRPARTRLEIGQKPAFEAKLLFGRQLGEVVPMGDGMDPGKEDDGIRDDY